MTDEREETPKEREDRLRAEGKCSCGAPLPTPNAIMCAACLTGMWDAHL